MHAVENGGTAVERTTFMRAGLVVYPCPVTVSAGTFRVESAAVLPYFDHPVE